MYIMVILMQEFKCKYYKKSIKGFKRNVRQQVR